jgi:uncharacterized OB-fold protein
MSQPSNAAPASVASSSTAPSNAAPSSAAPSKDAPKPPPAKMLPTIDDANRPFWTAAREGRLVMQQCAACGHIRNPIQALCPVCISAEFTWTELSGRGEVFAKVVYQRAFNPAWAADIPYNLVLVQLDEGPRMYSNVIGTPNDEIRVGDRLRVVFEPANDEISIPRFHVDR